MRYNWRQVADRGPLPWSFRHTLVTTSTHITKAYAVGMEEGASSLEIFELDCRLEAWRRLTMVSYEDEQTREAVSCYNKQEYAVAAVGDAIYVIGGTNAACCSRVLKFNTLELQWCSLSVADGPRDVSLCAASVCGESIILFGSLLRDKRPTSDVFLLNTSTGLWCAPKVLGTPPTLGSNHCATPLKGEKVIVSGGDDGDGWVLELRSPCSREWSKNEEQVVVWSKSKRGPLPLVICGPSGVGKGTLISRLMKDCPDKFRFSVSHTTRKPREKEVDGVHYHFTTRDAMERDIICGKFLEHANVHGNLYGTSVAAVEDVTEAGKTCILDIDVQGARSVRNAALPALFIFVAPPSFEELERRLRGRGTETEEQVLKRLETAKRELELGRTGDLFDHVLINDDLESTLDHLKSILGLTKDDGGVNHVDASSKLIAINSGKKLGTKLYIVDSPTAQDMRGLKWFPVEPSYKQVPYEYANHVNLSDIEILMTRSGDNHSIVLRLGK